MDFAQNQHQGYKVRFEELEEKYKNMCDEYNETVEILNMVFQNRNKFYEDNHLLNSKIYKQEDEVGNLKERIDKEKNNYSKIKSKLVEVSSDYDKLI